MADGTRILYNVATPFGGQLATMAAELVSGTARLERIKAAMSVMITWNTPVDYSGIEAEFGLAAGQGQKLWNLITGGNQIAATLAVALPLVAQIDQGLNL